MGEVSVLVAQHRTRSTAMGWPSTCFLSQRRDGLWPGLSKPLGWGALIGLQRLAVCGCFLERNNRIRLLGRRAGGIPARSNHRLGDTVCISQENERARMDPDSYHEPNADGEMSYLWLSMRKWKEEELIIKYLDYTPSLLSSRFCLPWSFK